MRKRNNEVGETLYISLGIHIEYPQVDLVKKQVTGTVLFNGKIHMTVFVDLQSDNLTVEGNVKGIDYLTTNNGENQITESDYIEQIRTMSKFFVENQISDPKKYYESFL